MLSPYLIIKAATCLAYSQAKKNQAEEESEHQVKTVIVLQMVARRVLSSLCLHLGDTMGNKKILSCGGVGWLTTPISRRCSTFQNAGVSKYSPESLITVVNNQPRYSRQFSFGLTSFYKVILLILTNDPAWCWAGKGLGRAQEYTGRDRVPCRQKTAKYPQLFVSSLLGVRYRELRRGLCLREA